MQQIVEASQKWKILGWHSPLSSDKKKLKYKGSGFKPQGFKLPKPGVGVVTKLEFKDIFAQKENKAEDVVNIFRSQLLLSQL